MGPVGRVSRAHRSFGALADDGAGRCSRHSVCAKAMAIFAATVCVADRVQMLMAASTSGTRDLSSKRACCPGQAAIKDIEWVKPLAQASDRLISPR